MRNLVGLDLATNTGWASAPPDGLLKFGTKTMPSTGDDIGRFLKDYKDWLEAFLGVETPAVVVFEAPILRNGRTHPTTARKLMCLAGLTELVCREMDIPVMEANLATVKKQFTGNGHAEKDDMLAAAKRWGWNVRNDNEADACAVWFYGVQQKAPKTFKERFGLGALASTAHGAA